MSRINNKNEICLKEDFLIIDECFNKRFLYCILVIN